MLILLAVVFILFWVKGIIFLDPDFGWHLRAGQLILQNGIPATDPFSYTMPSFPWVDHEWLTDAFTAFVYPFIGIIGLSFLFAILAITSVVVLVARNWQRWTITPVLLTLGILISVGGIRPQVMSWFFFSILLNLILDNRWQKWKWALPFLFFAWANLHGGFAIGVATLFLVIILRGLEQKKLNMYDIIILIVCTASTFINPYNIRLWEEIWRTASDVKLHALIGEWLPLIRFPDPPLWIIISSSCIMIWRYKSKFSFSELSLFAVLLLGAFSSARHVALWTLASLPLFNRSFFYLSQEAKRHENGSYRFTKAIQMVNLGMIIVFVLGAILAERSAWFFRESAFYPENAVQFLRAHPGSDQVFSTYAWGGYLIWKLPEKKVFIDGRMPSWSMKPTASEESENAFLDYQSVLNGKISFKDISQKYHIATVLWPTEKISNALNPDALGEKIVSYIHGQQKQAKIDFSSQLKNAGMREVWHDTTAVVYSK